MNYFTTKYLFYCEQHLQFCKKCKMIYNTSHVNNHKNYKSCINNYNTYKSCVNNHDTYKSHVNNVNDDVSLSNLLFHCVSVRIASVLS